MKRLFSIAVVLLFLAGCAAPCICPPENVMYGHGGCGDSYMPKDFFKKENRGLYWLPRDEYKEKQIDKSDGI
jgi:hypothetical protein